MPNSVEKTIMKWLRIAMSLACVGLLAVPARAQTNPSKPVTIVVSLSAGGAADAPDVENRTSLLPALSTR